MKNNTQPIRSTVIFGLLCGLLFGPLLIILGPVAERPQAMFLPIWLFVALYSVILTHWSPKGIKSILFPLLLILTAIPWVDSIALFLILIMGTLSWIRSGLCFANKVGKRIVVELGLGMLTGGLLAILNPNTLLTWALAAWMFFLVQALYFVFFEAKEMALPSLEPDPFEYAREQAENILANQA